MSIHNEIEPQAQTKQYKFEDVRGCNEAKDELVEVWGQNGASNRAAAIPRARACGVLAGDGVTVFPKDLHQQHWRNFALKCTHVFARTPLLPRVHRL